MWGANHLQDGGDRQRKTRLTLMLLESGAQTHFEGTASKAALAYPKNANVASAVAVAGLEFDKTTVRLIADANVSANIHAVEAKGYFGSFIFLINPLL